jgi:aryl-alcohol dehydrogenase-like predicted oxidoreductase
MNMEYRTLSTTGLKVSRLCLGTLTFGLQASEAEALRMVDRSLEAGINFLDTANVYNKGLSESILAKALAGRRQKVILASKAGLKAGEGPDESGLSRAALHKALESSLRRLATDYLDLYYLHLPDYNTPIEETLAALDELVRAGKVRYAAVSNFAAWQICEMHAIAAQNGFQPPRVSQPMYNVLARAIEDEYLPFCKRFQVAVVTYNPLAGGLLSGKQSRERGPIPGTRFDGNRIYLDRYWHDDYFAAVGELVGIARDAGKTPVELALQWVLGRPQVDAIVVGASNLAQLEQNLAASQRAPLDESLLARCDEVWKRFRGSAPKYNR